MFTVDASALEHTPLRTHAHAVRREVKSTVQEILLALRKCVRAYRYGARALRVHMGDIKSFFFSDGARTQQSEDSVTVNPNVFEFSSVQVL